MPGHSHVVSEPESDRDFTAQSRAGAKGVAGVEGETIIEVTKEHTDELDHLNHVEAVRYLETAREDWFKACGLYGASGFDYTLSAIVVNIHYNYRRECFLGERLRVLTRPVSRGRKSFVLAHEIVKPDGTLAIDGQATSLIFDMRTRETLLVPECLARHLPARA